MIWPVRVALPLHSHALCLSEGTDMEGPRMLAFGIFACTYLLMSKPHWRIVQLDRPTAGLLGAVLMVAAGVLTPDQAYRAVDWNTIVLLLGMFVLSGSLRLAGFFEWAADGVLTHVSTPTALLTALVFVSGLLSALLVNDTVCVMLAPLVIAMLERSDLPVLPYLFALASGANIGSVMTVVGNPQNIIIAHAAPLSYLAFARVLAPIGVLALGLAVVLLRGFFCQELQHRTIVVHASVTTRLDRALCIKSLLCLGLVLMGFLSGLQLAWTALSGATVLVFETARTYVRIGFWEFLRIGAPLTLLTTAAGVALLLVWS